ncbi:raffinose/stachyose/melibiose transport system permease protein [Kribbella amoyensis]|uniref:Raffinose/stachyose/melibiose transport system permease protein n=1 Tax=Kribbella amoyensis TaxID=996641 RepID=A0A561C0F8_9ACTN|nr:sugar ABC transporter permease [Kribbella amoyensis]TWD84631.1 raffinose/stachyose/melibiose transport system permease protein [Kribbella amoyensis]
MAVSSTVVPAAPRRPRRRRLAVYVTLAPVLATLVAFQYYPAVSGIWHSFFDWKPVGRSTFVGLDNYRTMLGDDLWWSSFRNLGVIFVFGVVMWAIPLLAAELLISLRHLRLQFLFRTLLIVPMAFPGVVTALVWSFMYHPNQGIINQALSAIGLPGLRQNWVGDPDLALISLLFIGFPFVAGLPFLIIYSSLRNIPAEIFEAAEIDGVGRLRRVWTIDLPLLAAQIKVLFFLAVVATLQYGFLAYIVTSGGPDGATSVPVLRMLDVAYQGGDWGYAAALSTTLFVITLALSCVVVFVRRSNSAADAKGM